MISIIITSYIPNDLRLKMLAASLQSLFDTTKNLPVEIIFVDNGYSDPEFSAVDLLTHYLNMKFITCYIRNAENQHFGEARNQGIAMAKGDYIVIADNDIYYEAGWLESCVDILKAYPDKKIYATPIQYPTSKMVGRYDCGVLPLGEQEFRLNMRAGSNCFVIRKKDLDIIGNFLAHRIAGTKWTDKAVKLGYLAAVTPVNMVKDLGLRLGYNLSEAISIKRTLMNGEEVILNQDELRNQ